MSLSICQRLQNSPHAVQPQTHVRDTQPRDTQPQTYHIRTSPLFSLPTLLLLMTPSKRTLETRQPPSVSLFLPTWRFQASDVPLLVYLNKRHLLLGSLKSRAVISSKRAISSLMRSAMSWIIYSIFNPQRLSSSLCGSVSRAVLFQNIGQFLI